jgi:hypothetical protein
LKRFCVALPFIYTSPFSRAPKTSIIAKLHRAIRPGHGRFHPQTGNKPSFIQKKIKCLGKQKQAARFVGSSMVTLAEISIPQRCNSALRALMISKTKVP